MERVFTSKQMGDACEMLVAAELTLARVPALKVPDNWPGYDVTAQPLGQAPPRISVKSRTYKRGGSNFVDYHFEDEFDWLAICILPLIPDGIVTASWRPRALPVKPGHAAPLVCSPSFPA